MPFNAIPLDQATADLANAGFVDYNNALQAAVAGAFAVAGITLTEEEAAQRTINFTAGQNAIVILDESLTDLSGASPLLLKFRHATAEDFILLTTSSLLGTLRDPNNAATVIGVGAPLLDAEVLTASEAAEIDVARVAYNGIIQAAADANDNLIYVDMASVLDTVASDEGFDFGIGVVSDDFATGGAFSLDGVHPTQKGYAIISNVVIDALNTNFNAQLPRANPADFPEVFFPFAVGHDFSQ